MTSHALSEAWKKAALINNHARLSCRQNKRSVKPCLSFTGTKATANPGGGKTPPTCVLFCDTEGTGFKENLFQHVKIQICFPCVLFIGRKQQIIC